MRGARTCLLALAWATGVGAAAASCFPSLADLTGAGAGGAAATSGRTAGPSTTAASTAGTGATTTGSTSSAGGAGGGGGAGGCAADLQSDGHDCGACGHDCQGGACSGGRCQPVVFAASQPHAVGDLHVDDAAVYWLAKWVILRLPFDGQGLPTALATPAGVGHFTVGSDAVYVVGGGGTDILLTPKDGSAASHVFHSGEFLRGVGTDEADVFTGNQSRQVLRFPVGPLDGGGGGGASAPATVVASTGAEVIALAIDAQNVYGSDDFGVVAAPKGGAGAAMIKLSDDGTVPDKNQHLAVDGNGVSWVVADAGAARYSLVAPKGIGALVAGGSQVTGVASRPGDAYVYATDRAGEVLRVPVAGGQPEVVATGQDGARLPAVTPGAVFWVVHPSGNPDDVIMKLVR